MNTTILISKSRVDGSQFLKEHTFENGISVPVYELSAVSAFNQLIGHAKFDNRFYGNVYYRGISGLYSNVLPALMRNRVNGNPEDLIKILKLVCKNRYLEDSLKLEKTITPQTVQDHCITKQIERYNKYRIEALLQHYAGSTRFLDVVDNHWIALWMGLHKFHACGKRKKYYHCIQRAISIGDIYESIIKRTNVDPDIYVYILLIAMPYPNKTPISGIIETDEFVEVDLRRALPSFYLRPHAQHALVIRKRNKGGHIMANYYDMSSQVIGILSVRIDKAAEWLGQGSLLTEQNLFPSPSIDQGYNTLLMHSDIFTHPFEIRKYF